jgi:hypothetical protein
MPPKQETYFQLQPKPIGGPRRGPAQCRSRARAMGGVGGTGSTESQRRWLDYSAGVACGVAPWRVGGSTNISKTVSGSTNISKSASDSTNTRWQRSRPRPADPLDPLYTMDPWSQPAKLALDLDLDLEVVMSTAAGQRHGAVGRQGSGRHLDINSGRDANRSQPPQKISEDQSAACEERKRTSRRRGPTRTGYECGSISTSCKQVATLLLRCLILHGCRQIRQIQKATGGKSALCALSLLPNGMQTDVMCWKNKKGV